MQTNLQLPWPEWKLAGKLGQEGAAQVYEIRRLESGVSERAAVKIISLPLREGPWAGLPLKQQVDRITQAFEQMYRLRDLPHVVRYDAHSAVNGDDTCTLYLRTEAVQTLQWSYGELSRPEAVRRLGVELCGALAACREKGVIHGGIGPQCIFRGEDGTFKLDGFSGEGLISPAQERIFRAPELLQGKGPTHQSDLYSLGLTLYWLLNERRPPFAKPLPARLDQAMLETCIHCLESGEQLPPPRNGSERLKQLVLKACAFQSRKRFADAAQLKQQLQALALEPDAAAESRPEPGPGPRPAPEPVPPVRRRWLPLLAGAALMAVLVLAWFLWSNRAQIPEDAVEFGGHHYYMYDEPVADYEAALSWCKDLGGHMAAVNSAEENRFLHDYLVSMGYDHAYLGCTDAEEDGVWVWSTGEEFLYQNWNAGEPNNDLGGESHVAMYRVLSDGSWNDIVFAPPSFQDGTPAIRGASATSQREAAGTVFGPGALVDGDPATAWYEGVGGPGIGESVTLEFRYPSRLTGFSIAPGDQSDPTLYASKSRPSVVELCFDGRLPLTFVLEDDCREQSFVFDEPVLADSVTVTIRSVYPGLEFEHTAISELTFREESRKTGFLCEWDR